jgi:hypothetical protein
MVRSQFSAILTYFWQKFAIVLETNVMINLGQNSQISSPFFGRNYLKSTVSTAGETSGISRAIAQHI